MVTQKILAVEPNSRYSHLLRQLITNDGYAFLTVNHGEKALQLIAEERPSLLITELMLTTKISGLELIQRVRQFSTIPIMVLSAHQEVDDILKCYQSGADDYIIKPFEGKILLARIKVLLNRCSVENPTSPLLNFEHLTINLQTRQVTSYGLPIYLTDTEYHLLAELAKHHDQVVIHEHLLETVWGREYQNEINYLRSYIHMLRRKIEKDPSQPKILISRAGIGYMLISKPSE